MTSEIVFASRTPSSMASTSAQSSDTMETAREYGDYTSSIYLLADSSTLHGLYRKLKVRRWLRRRGETSFGVSIPSPASPSRLLPDIPFLLANTYQVVGHGLRRRGSATQDFVARLQDS